MASTFKEQELERLRARVQSLEAEVSAETAAHARPLLRGYTAYYAAAGCLLGIFGAMVSLLFNMMGALVAGKDPLELIRIYLTFPLGEGALALADGSRSAYAVNNGVILALGCFLYLVTGMLLGMPVYLALRRFADKATIARRLLVAGLVSLAIWAINFYGILSWLQPLLLGGHWIVNNQLLPWWVAAATHLVFGWTIAWLYPLGQFTPYTRPTQGD